MQAYLPWCLWHHYQPSRCCQLKIILSVNWMLHKNYFLSQICFTILINIFQVTCFALDTVNWNKHRRTIKVVYIYNKINTTCLSSAKVAFSIYFIIKILLESVHVFVMSTFINCKSFYLAVFLFQWRIRLQFYKKLKD